MVTAENAAHLLDMARLAQDFGADVLQLVRFQLEGRGRDCPQLYVSEADFRAAAACVALILTPVATLFDEAVVFSCRPLAKFRFFQEQFLADPVPKMFTIRWNNEVLISHLRLTVGEFKADGLADVLIKAQTDNRIQLAYLAWLHRKQTSMLALRSELGMATP